MRFAEKLKKLRISKNYTQEELAKKLNISRQSISKWELGQNEPSIEMLKEICNVLDVSISDLIDDDKDVVTSNEKKLVKRNETLLKVVIAVAMIMFLITLIFIRFVNEKIPMHYDIDFNVTRYGSKWELMLFPLSVVCIILAFTIGYYKRLLKRGKDELKMALMIQIINLALEIFFIIVVLIMGFINLKNPKEDFFSIITLIVLASFLVLSIFSLPYFNPKKNISFGFRTNFTLKNQKNWYLVNKFQAISALIMVSLAFIITITIGKPWTICFLSAPILSLIPTLIYHENLRKKEK